MFNLYRERGGLVELWLLFLLVETTFVNEKNRPYINGTYREAAGMKGWQGCPIDGIMR